MTKRIFISLPVADVARATAFYEAIGFVRNAEYSGDHASSMVWSDGVVVMLASREFYATLTTKPIADSQTTSAMLIAFAKDSREEVDAITEAALAAGGTEAHGPQDEGFMYSRAFYDLDGHGFGPFWMDGQAASQRAGATAA